MTDPQPPIRDLQPHADIDPNKVTLVHPDGANDVVHEAVNAAQRALQDSVDLFGALDRPVPPPLGHDMLLLGRTNPELSDEKAGTGPQSNEYFRHLIEQDSCIQELIGEGNSIALKVKFIDDLNRSTLERIRAEIVFLNDSMRSARPPMDSNPNNAETHVDNSHMQKDMRRSYLTDSDTQAVLRIIGDSTARVAGWVAECQKLNKAAAPSIASPAPPSSAPPPDLAALTEHK
ncbi:hypothetical protein [Nocardia sp. NPDC004604]|uniref:hypothetical protein n=1 Tax=Nocardia sp. NPDC004604 TaxID=3157013 RepID=UPI0033AA066C